MADNGDWRDEGENGGSKIGGRREERKGKGREVGDEGEKEAEGRKGGPQCM